MSKKDPTLNACGCCEGIEALTPLPVENQPGLSALSFRAGTHASFKTTMLSALSRNETLRRLGTRDDDDPTIALCDAWATVLDVFTFYQERIVNEGFLKTATERRSILQMARSIGYELSPGVAAGTYLAFTLDSAPGAPLSAQIGVGTKVQSVPAQDELPQIFETTEQLEAWNEWSQMKPQTNKKEIPGHDDKEVYLEGITTELKPGDGLLMIGAEREDDPSSERWDFRRVDSVTPYRDADFTRVTWKKGLGWRYRKKRLPAEKDFKVFALRQRAFLFGHNAPDWRNLPDEVRNRYLNGDENASKNNTDEEWNGLEISSISNTPAGGKLTTVYLDSLYPEIVEGSWLILARPDLPGTVNEDEFHVEVYEVLSAIESSRKGFTLTAKTTAVELEGEKLREKFNDAVRDTVAFGQSEKLEIAERPVTDPVEGDEIVLDKRLPDLPEKRTIIVSGKRARVEIVATFRRQVLRSEDGKETVPLSLGDSLVVMKRPEPQSDGKMQWTLMDKNGFTGTVSVRPGKLNSTSAREDDGTISEVATIDSVDTTSDPTLITLSSPLDNNFDRSTVVIYANVASATHGETKNETLGSGDGSRVFQKFALKQKPITYVSAATPTGGKSSLEVRVNNILWEEVSSLDGLGPEQRAYTTRLADDGTVTVHFGDGINGARTPTGVENVTATYRVGTGLDGMLEDKQLTTLITQTLGVKESANPLAPTGAADPESLDDARRNAPLTVLTFERIVSLKDFEDFANAFAGIGKAQANVLWDGEQRLVHITVAGADGGAVNTSSDLFKNLGEAIQSSRHSEYRAEINSYEALTFDVKANVWTHEDYIAEDVLASAEIALLEKFSFEKRSFGQAVTASELMSVIQQIDGIVAVDLDELHFTSHRTDLYDRLPESISDWEVTRDKPARLLTVNPKGITLLAIK